jgi:hypothetical protein
MAMAVLVVRGVLALVLLATLLSLQLPSGSFGQSLDSSLAQGSRVPLPGHVLPALAEATPVEDTAADGAQVITFSVLLRPTTRS